MYEASSSRMDPGPGECVDLEVEGGRHGAAAAAHFVLLPHRTTPLFLFFYAPRERLLLKSARGAEGRAALVRERFFLDLFARHVRQSAARRSDTALGLPLRLRHGGPDRFRDDTVTACPGSPIASHSQPFVPPPDAAQQAHRILSLLQDVRVCHGRIDETTLCCDAATGALTLTGFEHAHHRCLTGRESWELRRAGVDVRAVQGLLLRLRGAPSPSPSSPHPCPPRVPAGPCLPGGEEERSPRPPQQLDLTLHGEAVTLRRVERLGSSGAYYEDASGRFFAKRLRPGPRWEAKQRREARVLRLFLRTAAARPHLELMRHLPELVHEEDGALLVMRHAGAPLAPCNRPPDLEAQVCALLRAMEAADVAHTDISAAELLVGPDGTLRLVDFGDAVVSARAHERDGDRRRIRAAVGRALEPHGPSDAPSRDGTETSGPPP